VSVQIQHPLAVVTPTLDGDILTALARADAGFTPGGLARLLSAHSVEGVRRAVRRLAGQGIVDARQVGRAFEYRLNRDHLAAGPIIALAGQWRTLLERMEQELSAWRQPPVYGAVFGSAARGDMRADSDLDVFLVAPDDVDQRYWDGAVASFQQVVTRWTGNDTRVLAMSESEVRAAVRDGAPILRSVADEGVAVVGSPSWLRRLATG